jgi:hypothetical protein
MSFFRLERINKLFESTFTNVWRGLYLGAFDGCSDGADAVDSHFKRPFA